MGHAMLSRVGLEGVDRHVLTLAPVLVKPECQGRGVGSALTEDALFVADQAAEPMVIVLGDPVYYTRLGFEPASTYGQGRRRARLA